MILTATPIMLALKDTINKKPLLGLEHDLRTNLDYKFVPPMTVAVTSGQLLTMDTPFYNGVFYINKLPQDKVLPAPTITIESLKIMGIEMHKLQAAGIGAAAGSLIGSIVLASLGSSWLGPIGMAISLVGFFFAVHSYLKEQKEMENMERNRSLGLSLLLSMTTNLRCQAKLSRELVLVDYDYAEYQNKILTLCEYIEDRCFEFCSVKEYVVNEEEVLDLYKQVNQRISDIVSWINGYSAIYNSDLIRRYGSDSSLQVIQDSLGVIVPEKPALVKEFGRLSRELVQKLALPTKSNLNLVKNSSMYMLDLSKLSVGEHYYISETDDNWVTHESLVDRVPTPVYKRLLLAETLDDWSVNSQNDKIKVEVTTRLKGIGGSSLLSPAFNYNFVGRQSQFAGMVQKGEVLKITINSQDDGLASAQSTEGLVKVPMVLRSSSALIPTQNKDFKHHVSPKDFENSSLLAGLTAGKHLYGFLRARGVDFSKQNILELESKNQPIQLWLEGNEVFIGTHYSWYYYGFGPNIPKRVTYAQLKKISDTYISDKTNFSRNAYLFADLLTKELAFELTKVKVCDLELVDCEAYSKVGYMKQIWKAKCIKGEPLWWGPVAANGFVREEHNNRGTRLIRLDGYCVKMIYNPKQIITGGLLPTVIDNYTEYTNKFLWRD